MVKIVNENALNILDPDSGDNSAQFLPINVSIPINKEDGLNKGVSAPPQPHGELGTPELPWKFPRLDVLSELTFQGICKASSNIKVTLLSGLMIMESLFSEVFPNLPRNLIAMEPIGPLKLCKKYGISHILGSRRIYLKKLFASKALEKTHIKMFY